MSDSNIAADVVDVTTAVLSNVREKILEHRLVSDLAEVMLRRGVEMDVMRSEFDAHGHDIVLEAVGEIRHVQLKAMLAGGKRRDVNVNVRLGSRPSGCVVWMVYEPATLQVIEYRWFGGTPGEALPDLGTKIARHAKGNATGEKTLRTGQRLISKTMFDVLPGLAGLADRLFGPARSPATSLVLSQLRMQFGLEWRQRVPATMGRADWEGSIELAHLVDGYRVLEQLGKLSPDDWIVTRAAEPLAESQRNDLGDLWTTLFLEHRRWRFASPFEPTGKELDRLNQLVLALHAAIESELSSRHSA